MKKQISIPLIFLCALIQGCAYRSDYTQRVIHQLAENRVDLLTYDKPDNSDFELVYQNVKGNLIQLAVKMPSLSESQAKTLPDSITNAYCSNMDTRHLLDAGVSYHLSVLNKQLEPLASFYVDASRCPD